MVVKDKRSAQERSRIAGELIPHHGETRMFSGPGVIDWVSMTQWVREVSEITEDLNLSLFNLDGELARDEHTFWALSAE